MKLLKKSFKRVFLSLFLFLLVVACLFQDEIAHVVVYLVFVVAEAGRHGVVFHWVKFGFRRLWL